MTFGENLREARELCGLSQRELASKVDTYSQRISEYERDLVLPSIYMAKDLADALGISIDYLVKT